jgi:hypothetical protein
MVSCELSSACAAFEELALSLAAELELEPEFEPWYQ